MTKDNQNKKATKIPVSRKQRDVHLFETSQFKEDLRRSISKNFKKTYPQGMKEETTLPLDQLLAPCKKTRGKKGRITRPQNAFILYRKDVQAKIKRDNPNAKFEQVSKIVGELWKKETNPRKNNYILLSNLCSLVHQDLFPNYKFKPRSKDNGEQETNSTTPEDEEELRETVEERTYEQVSQLTSVEHLSSSFDINTIATAQYSCRTDNAESVQAAVELSESSFPIMGMPVYGEDSTLQENVPVNDYYDEAGENPLEFQTLDFGDLLNQQSFYVAPRYDSGFYSSPGDAQEYDYSVTDFPTIPSTFVDTNTNAASLPFSYDTSVNGMPRNVQQPYDIGFLGHCEEDQIIRIFSNAQHP
ncbi:16104_t:CDS:1 [Acaulospora colombiana]|uniref:16104_t:CDS:1 n=1 Tax=Acaulospora colombiana TaxID=27376 RepID=A0ACA9L6Y2_9GLOM|nr:16104_t:CDS:1 [Acaulospora colombiana]